MVKTAESKKNMETLLSGLVLDHLYRWVEQTLGIRAGDDALEKLREYLERRCGASYFEAPAAFEAILASPDEIYTVTQLVTINETYFFREEAHFDLLLRELLPRFARLGRPVRVCSAATSIGCEAYSIAMVMDYFSQTVEPLAFEIDAFDLNPMVIDAARKGRYTQNAFRTDGSRWKDVLDRYVSQEGTDYLVSGALQKYIHFYPHNIMNGFKGRYDLIFFRNALIYFSAENRRTLLGLLAEALNEEGFLLLGTAETPSISHPLLVNKLLRENFCFQRIREDAGKISTERRLTDRRVVDRRTGERRGTPADRTEGQSPVPADRAADTAAPERTESGRPAAGSARLAALIADNGGEASAQRVLKALGNPAGNGGDIPEEDLCAAAIYLLGVEDFAGADPVIAFLERHSVSAFAPFLRGEFYFHKNKIAEAGERFKEAAGRDGAFWPAFYRMSSLAAGGDRKRYEYRIKRALESIELGKDKHYENFIGGFSPDYYRQALERRITEEAGNDNGVVRIKLR